MTYFCDRLQSIRCCLYSSLVSYFLVFFPNSPLSLPSKRFDGCKTETHSKIDVKWLIFVSGIGDSDIMLLPLDMALRNSFSFINTQTQFASTEFICHFRSLVNTQTQTNTQSSRHFSWMKKKKWQLHYQFFPPLLSLSETGNCRQHTIHGIRQTTTLTVLQVCLANSSRYFQYTIYYTETSMIHDVQCYTRIWMRKLFSFWNQVKKFMWSFALIWPKLLRFEP